MYAVEQLSIDRYFFLLLLQATLGRCSERQANTLLFAAYLLFFQSHADIEVISLVLFLYQGHPFVYLLFLQFYLTDVGLIPIQPVHGKTKHQHQHT